jgi:tripartite-type tricarboxylate transporter receptor subunit TctC
MISRMPESARFVGFSMKSPRRSFLHLTVGAAAAVLAPRGATAQNYPARPVRLLIGFPPGGGSDVGGRILANRLSEVWGQQVVVENKPGAGGHLAIDVAAHANADGYTMIWVGGAIPLYGLMIASINYDPEADLAPVTLVGTYPNILAVPNASPWHSVEDMIAAAKANPGHVTFSSPGVGTSPHLTGMLFARMAGIDIRHVPYRGGAPALTDLIAGPPSERARCAASRSHRPSGLPRRPSCRRSPNPACPTLT